MDFRDVKSVNRNGVYRYQKKDKPDGIVIDLGKESEFDQSSDYVIDNLRITNYDPDILRSHHDKNKHEYCIHKLVLESDVVINMPKPKTHRKAGVTVSLKNLVGINARKEFLPHHTNGSVEEGGDQYCQRSYWNRKKSICLDKKDIAAQTLGNVGEAKFWTFWARFFSAMGKLLNQDHYFEGSWHGNQTISKTITDINKIFLYADKDGKLQDKIQRRYLIVADMIISGEGEGPLCPSPKDVGILAIGDDSYEFDRTIAKLMGANIDKLPMLEQVSRSKSKYRITKNFGKDTKIKSNDPSLDGKPLEMFTEEDILYFRPTSGWKEAFVQKNHTV